MRATYGLLAVLLLGQTGSSDIPFKLQKIDAGQSEAAALLDLNNDGRLDIIAAEEAGTRLPAWTKRPISAPFRCPAAISTTSATCRWTSMATAGPTSSRSVYFARRIVWMKNPGAMGGGLDRVLDRRDRSPPNSPSWSIWTMTARRASCCRSSPPRGLPLRAELVRVPRGQVGEASGQHPIAMATASAPATSTATSAPTLSPPRGWLEAPADLRAPGEWKFHPAHWQRAKPIPPPAPGYAVSPTEPPAVAYSASRDARAHGERGEPNGASCT